MSARRRSRAAAAVAPIDPPAGGPVPEVTALRPVEVSEVSVDPFTNMPVVVLTCARSRTSLPLFIGLAEASAITTELEKIALERPVTHDLLRDVLRCSGVSVEHVAVDDVRDGTVYATIHLVRSGKDGGAERFALDARPSDAIAIALRTSARILVEEKVFAKLGVSAAAAAVAGAARLPVTSPSPPTPPPAACGLPGQVTGLDEAQLRAFLESLDDHEFGKWKQ